MPASVTAVSVLHEFLPNPFRPIGTTAIDKRPVAGRVAVDLYGLAGDSQCDREVHGGRYQAVYAYADEDEVTGARIPCRTFGERMGEDRWVRRFGDRGLSGAYLRVLRPGDVGV